MVIFCMVVFIIEALGLLTIIIINQKKIEKEYREPVINIIFAYLACVVFPTIVGLLWGGE